MAFQSRHKATQTASWAGGLAVNWTTFSLMLHHALHSIRVVCDGDWWMVRACVQTVNYLAYELKKAEFKVCCLHGECRQEKRDEAINAFKAGKAQILVATDVAARGLHIRNLPYIVNYDFPSNMPAYVHRAGRTGRLRSFIT